MADNQKNDIYKFYNVFYTRFLSKNPKVLNKNIWIFK